jgi:hypothetical protein
VALAGQQMTGTVANRIRVVVIELNDRDVINH